MQISYEVYTFRKYHKQKTVSSRIAYNLTYLQENTAKNRKFWEASKKGEVYDKNEELRSPKKLKSKQSLDYNNEVDEKATFCLTILGRLIQFYSLLKFFPGCKVRQTLKIID